MKEILLFASLFLASIAQAQPTIEEAAQALREGNFTLAKEAFLGGPLSNEEGLKRALISARACFFLGEYKRASQLFEALRDAPILPESAKATVLYYAAESLFRNIEREEAKELFAAFIERYPDDPFCLRAKGRLADIALAQGESAAALSMYQTLKEAKEVFFDPSQISYSIAALLLETGKTQEGLQAFSQVMIVYPASPAGRAAKALLEKISPELLIGQAPNEKLQRAQALLEAMQPKEACEEAKALEKDLADSSELITLLGKCALQEKDHLAAGALFYKAAGDDPAKLYRAISAYTSASGEIRSQGYEEARKKIKELLERFPTAKEAQKAQYKAAWLDYHEGKYLEAAKALEVFLQKYPNDTDAQWYAGWSYYLQKDSIQAEKYFLELSTNTGPLIGGKGLYWAARMEEIRGDEAKAKVFYSRIMKQWPLGYYALLAKERLLSFGVEPMIFPGVEGAPFIEEPLSVIAPQLETEPALEELRFWLSVGYQAEAKEAVERATKLLQERYPKEAPLLLCALYQASGEFKKGLELAWEKEALSQAPIGEAKRWWACAYPKAHRSATEAAAKERGLSPYFVWSLMRQESAYSPFLVSRADAVGLLQLLPKTAAAVAKDLGISSFFWADLFGPKENLRLATAYLERLSRRFSGQLWLTAAAYNGGPAAVARWLLADGSRPFDELVEQISYSESREYTKKVAGHFARYWYLYEGAAYEIDTQFTLENDPKIVDF